MRLTDMHAQNAWIVTERVHFVFVIFCIGVLSNEILGCQMLAPNVCESMTVRLKSR